ncbi:hypothetical protein A2U01_0050083, partial [Trifolium medium]|nr:hypothetical protein [Trifolium medium]
MLCSKRAELDGSSGGSDGVDGDGDEFKFAGEGY